MSNEDYMIRFGAIQKDLSLLRTILEDAQNHSSEMVLRTPSTNFRLEDALPKEDHDVVKKVVIDALRRNIVNLEAQLEGLTRDWLSIRHLERAEVTA